MKQKHFEDWYARVGNQLVEREVAKAMFELFREQILGKVKRERSRYRKALKKIRRLNPEDTSGNYKEWGEAYCFQRARDIAGEALVRSLWNHR
jgi:hypothetical protein